MAIYTWLIWSGGHCNVYIWLFDCSFCKCTERAPIKKKTAFATSTWSSNIADLQPRLSWSAGHCNVYIWLFGCNFCKRKEKGTNIKKQHLQYLLKQYCQSPTSTKLISWTMQLLSDQSWSQNHPLQNVICSDYSEPVMIADKATVVHNLLFWSGHWAMRVRFQNIFCTAVSIVYKSFFLMSKCSALSGRCPQTAVQ